MTDKAAYVAEFLLGAPLLQSGRDLGEHDIHSPDEVYLYKHDGVETARIGGRMWNPYESADDDYRVLVAVREKWSGTLGFDRFDSRIDGVNSRYQPGDYTDAAYAVLKKNE